MEGQRHTTPVMTPDGIVSVVRALGLPDGDYAVFGSGPLGVRGLRPVQDIDLVVTAHLFSALAARPDWTTGRWAGGAPYVAHGIVEASADWSVGSYSVDAAALVRRADVILGVPFVRLLDVRAWKRAAGREKDRGDVALIDAYLRSGVRPPTR